MPAEHCDSRLEQVARRWHDLAERRLAYFTELYRSGRWQHYYTQEQFGMRMLDVIKAARVWRDLAGRSQPALPEIKRDDDLRPAA